MAHELRIRVAIPLEGDAMARAKEITAFEETLDGFAEAVVRAGGDIGGGLPGGAVGRVGRLSHAHPFRIQDGLADQSLVRSPQEGPGVGRDDQGRGRAVRSARLQVHVRPAGRRRRDRVVP